MSDFTPPVDGLAHALSLARAMPSYGERIEIRRVKGRGYVVLSHRADGQACILGRSYAPRVAAGQVEFEAPPR